MEEGKRIAFAVQNGVQRSGAIRPLRTRCCCIGWVDPVKALTRVISLVLNEASH